MSRKGFAASIARVAALVSALLAGAATEASAAGSISGRVTSSTTSLGLGGTVVQVFDLDNDLFAGTATADSNGFYTISLPASLYAVFTYNTQGYINEIYNNIQCSAVCDVDAITPITVATNPVTDVNFVLDPGGRIAGRVTDSVTGVGIADVIVNFTDPGDNVEFTTAKTDATGNYLSDGGTATGNIYAATQNTLGYRNEVFENIHCDPRLRRPRRRRHADCRDARRHEDRHRLRPGPRRAHHGHRHVPRHSGTGTRDRGRHLRRHDGSRCQRE